MSKNQSVQNDDLEWFHAHPMRKNRLRLATQGERGGRRAGCTHAIFMAYERAVVDAIFVDLSNAEPETLALMMRRAENVYDPVLDYALWRVVIGHIDGAINLDGALCLAEVICGYRNEDIE